MFQPEKFPLLIVGLRVGRYLIDRILRGEEGAEVRIAAACDRAAARRTLDANGIARIVEGICVIAAMAESDRTGAAVDVPAR